MHRLVLTLKLGTVQTGTGKVDPARKLKCTTATRAMGHVVSCQKDWALFETIKDSQMSVWEREPTYWEESTWNEYISILFWESIVPTVVDTF